MHLSNSSYRLSLLTVLIHLCWKSHGQETRQEPYSLIKRTWLIFQRTLERHSTKSAYVVGQMLASLWLDEPLLCVTRMFSSWTKLASTWTSTTASAATWMSTSQWPSERSAGYFQNHMAQHTEKKYCIISEIIDMLHLLATCRCTCDFAAPEDSSKWHNTGLATHLHRLSPQGTFSDKLTIVAAAQIDPKWIHNAQSQLPHCHTVIILKVKYLAWFYDNIEVPYLR